MGPLQARSTSPSAEARASSLSTWQDAFLAAVVGLAVLTFYVATLAPTVLWGDDAYFQRTAFEDYLRPDGGGHWLWLRTARLFLRLPRGDAAFRVNLLSATAAACACALVYAAGKAIGLGRTGATISAVSLAVSHTFWAHAVRAEVYSLYMLVMALQLWLWLAWRRERTWPLLAAVLLFGTALLGHQMAVLLIPAFGLQLWQRRRWLKPRHWLAIPLLLAAGLLPFLSVVRSQVASGDLITDLRLYFTHSSDDYRHALLDFSLASLPRDAVLWIGLLGLQFVGVAGLLGLWGWADAWRRDRFTPWAVVGLLYITNALFAFSYHVSDQYVFYLPSYLAFALFAGRGWQALSNAWRGSRRKVSHWLAIGLVGVIPVLTYRTTVTVLNALDLNPMGVRELPNRDPNLFFLWPAKNGYFGAANYGHSALETLPPDSILIADYTPFETFRYLQSVEGLRPDVRVEIASPGGNLEPTLARLPSGPQVFLADDDPKYYGWRSLPGATLQRVGVIHRLIWDN